MEELKVQCPQCKYEFNIPIKNKVFIELQQGFKIWREFCKKLDESNEKQRVNTCL